MEKSQELEQLQLQMQNLLKNIKAKEEYIALLETLPTIMEYNAYLYDKEKLQEEYEQKKEEYEKKIGEQQELLVETCPHPLWHFLKDLTNECDISFSEVNYSLKCIRCGYNSPNGYRFKMEEWFKKSNVIYDKDKIDATSETIPYEVVRQEFLELESEGYSFEEIREILYSKYTEKNEDLARNLKMKYISKHGE